VVCDDESADDTIAVLEDFRLSAPFDVRIFRNEENLGYARNFEKAAGLCTGELIFLSDQDDVWLDRKIETVVAAFARTPGIMVVINDQVIANEDLSTHGPTKLQNIARLRLSSRQMIAGCCSAHRRKWRDLVLPLPSVETGHDHWINGLAQELGLALVIEEALQLYRRHDKNASNHLFSSRKDPRLRWAVAALRVTDDSAAWRNRLELQKAKLSWYSSHFAHLRKMGVEARAAEQIDRAERRHREAEQLLAALSRGGMSRVLAISRLWANGVYRDRAGWMSALKDLVRPRPPPNVAGRG
jgi:glycosyltransferase involved in cell wall biosynthesis